MQVIGVRNIDFQPKDGSTRVTGVRIYAVYEDKDVEGKVAEVIYCPQDKMQEGYQPKVGDEINVYYNRFKKVEKVEKIKQ